MYRIIKYLFLVTTIFLLSACSTTDLSYKNSILSLKVDGNHLELHGLSLGESRDNFGNLYIFYRALKLDSGNIVVYENVRTDSNYEFNFTTIKTIQVLFDTVDIREIYFSNSFYILQLTLNDGRVLNTIVEQLEDQSINIAYGFSNSQLYDLLKELNAKPFNSMYSNTITIKSIKKSIFSNWTTSKVHFVPLIVPIRLMGFR